MDHWFVQASDHGLGGRDGTMALVGGFIGLFATYWDDAWHTDRGRDSLGSPPHVALYAGVLVGLLVALRWARRDRHPGWWWLAAVPGSRTALAGWGAVAVLVSAPVDEFWHAVYGRDAVLWSPPHLLAISGSIALFGGLVLGLERDTTRARLGAAVALGAFLVPVMEYEADVPQFAAAFYLPAVVLGIGLARDVIVAAVGSPWALTIAAISYTAFRLLIVGGLDALGHSTPIVPPILLAALAVDAAALLGRRWVDAAALGVVVPIIHIVTLMMLPASPAGRGGDLVVGVVLASLVALVVAVRGGGLGRPVITGTLVVAITTGVLALPAAAHDPGQGEVIGEVQLRVAVERLRFDVIADLPDDMCPGDAVSILGRRGGRTLRVPARLRDGCMAAAVLTVDEPGRWFLYVEQGSAEAWAAVEAGNTRAESVTRQLYRRPEPPHRASQAIAGVLLVLIAATLVCATTRAAAARTARIRLVDA